ncbi:hypothetical protein BC937DRAFT_87498 [Endogone sp. FLAS-F59071]|nr:hypothetical protein BC937DRAFT_87498 [Endogone sp. FLAS-F59071]|eukprot:RUS12575.1 hypothetical protein BC937DRAFT_87498 [Endogone sp. FLAS-F59071]
MKSVSQFMEVDGLNRTFHVQAFIDMANLWRSRLKIYARRDCILTNAACTKERIALSSSNAEIFLISLQYHLHFSD